MTPSGKKKRSIDLRDEATIFKVLAHPLRVRIIEVCNERRMSPVIFVEEKLQPPGVTFSSKQNAMSNVASHFRYCERKEAIKLVKRIPRGGSSEHVYIGTGRLFYTNEEYAELTPEQRLVISRASFQGFGARVDSAMRARTFDSRDDRHSTWNALELDDVGMDRMMAILDRAFYDLQKLAKDTKARLEKTGAPSIAATFGLFGFESPPPSGTPDPPTYEI